MQRKKNASNKNIANKESASSSIDTGSANPNANRLNNCRNAKKKAFNENLTKFNCMDKPSISKNSKGKVEENFKNVGSLANTTDDAKDEYKKMEHSNTERCTDSSGFNDPTNSVYNQQNNDGIFLENIYFLPDETITILPPRPYIVFQPVSYFERPQQCVVNRIPCDFGYQNEFLNGMSYDQQQYYDENTTAGQNPENYSGCLNVLNAYSNDLQKKPFVLSWVDKGETYFQYYPDFAPIAYPCSISLAGQGYVNSLQDQIQIIPQT